MNRSRSGRLALACVLLLPLASAQARAAELVSKAGRICVSGASDSLAVSRSLSADGRYLVFSSRSTNLVAGQSTRFENVFLRDRVTEANVLVSRKEGFPTTGGNGDSGSAVVSADGNVVVFRSQARNLIPVQLGHAADNLLLWERSSGAVTLITHTFDATNQGAGGSAFSSVWLSQDGRYVAYDDHATDLVAGQADANDDFDVFLYDRMTGSSILVSHTSASPTTAGNGRSRIAGLSADGRYLVFTSSATNIAPGGAGTFLYDRVSGTTTRLAPDGEAAISADGNFVALGTSANLAPGQTDPQGVGDVYLYDRQAGTFALVSHASGAALASGNRSSYGPVLSGDGRYVAYRSDASNLVAGQTVQQDEQVFLYDRITGTNVLASHASTSPTAPSNDRTLDRPTLSQDGRYVAFISEATDLIAGQTGGGFAYDLFLYDRDTGAVTMPSHAHDSAQRQTGGASVGPIVGISLSADGRWLAFPASSDRIDADDCNDGYDVFLYDRTTGAARVASAHDPSSPSVTAAGRSRLAARSAVSDDGRFAVFESEATNLVAGGTDANEGLDVFLHDRETGSNVLVSGSAADPHRAANQESTGASISADGRWVAFLSEATDLVASGPPGSPNYHVYLYDRVSGSKLLASRAFSSPTASGNGWSAGPAALSGDGRYVAFSDTSTDLVAGQADSAFSWDVFVFDRLTGTTSLISRAAGSAVQAAGGHDPWISADGRYVTFVSEAHNLVPGAAFPDNHSSHVYLHDRRTGTTTLVSRAAGLPPGTLQAGNASSYGPALSADGRFVGFLSLAGDLVPGQSDPVQGSDVFLFDQALGTVTLVSHAAGAPATAGNGISEELSLSGDGTFVAFVSRATNLVAGQDTNGWYDVFLYDRRSGGVTLVSHREGFPTVAGDSGSLQPSVSADGKVAFLSGAENLESGSGPRAQSNTFLFDPASGENRLLSALQPASSGASFEIAWTGAVSRNGRSVYFTATGDLVPGDHNGLEDVFADHAAAPATDYYTLEPCRLLDTREPGDGPALISGIMELLAVHGECGIPATARALVVNVTVLGATARGNLRFHEGGLAAPAASTINFAGGEIRANNAILPLTLAERGLGVTPLVVDGGTAHLILDVFGWFE